MGVSDILDTAFKLLRACAVPTTLIVLLILGPVQVLASVAFVSPFAVLSEPVPTTVDVGRLALAFAGTLIGLLVSPLVMGAATWLGAHADADQVPGWGAGLAAGARRYPAILGAFAVLVAVVLGGLVAGGLLVAMFVAVDAPVVAAIVGVPLLLAWLLLGLGATVVGYLVVPPIVVEGLGPMEGLRRAWRLLRARFWPTIGLSLLMGLVVTLLGSAVSTVISLPAFIPFPGSWVFVALGAIVDRLITVPLAAFAALAIHVDQRIRTEGYDIAVLVSDLRR